jgi:hypothetical protein
MLVTIGVDMFEHHHESIIPRTEFFWRVAKYSALSIGTISISLLIGIFGYHYLEGLSWIDSLVNASMLLGGMGPVNPLVTTAGKFFASFYALFSGMILLVAVSILIAPIFHRFLHHFHLEIEDKDE